MDDRALRPRGPDELLAAHDRAAALGERGQDAELGRRERHRAGLAAESVHDRVEPDRADVDRGAAPVRAAQEGAHARDDLVDLDRLEDVVVVRRAEVGGRAGGRVAADQEERGRRDALGAHRGAEIVAVGVGQLGVDDERVRRCRQVRQRADGGVDAVNLEAGVLEPAGEPFAPGGVAFHDEDSGVPHVRSRILRGT